jgi:zinc transport system substrate-binding protein
MQIVCNYNAARLFAEIGISGCSCFPGRRSGWSQLLALIMALLGQAVLAQSPPLKVATSFFPIYSLAASIIGTNAAVTNLLPGDVGPHEFQLSPRDLRKLEQSSLFIINGLNLESWFEPALSKANGSGAKTVIKLSDGLQDRLIHDSNPHAHGTVSGRENAGDTDINAHIWLDPTLAAHGATNILRALVKLDPAHHAAYEANAAQLIKRLQKLDEDFKRELAPVKGNAFITYHQAFPYLIRRYGLNLAGVLEEVPDVEPSARHLAELSRTIREQKVKVLFVEPLSSTKLAEQLARDCHIKIAELDTLEAGPLTPTGYEEKMHQNLVNLVKGLQ